MTLQVPHSTASDDLCHREAVLRHHAAETQDPEMRTILTTLADRCVVRRARERCVERVQMDDPKCREHLLTASRLMDNALILLDESDCGLPATKLAEAIQCLHLAMSCGRALDP